MTKHLVFFHQNCPGQFGPIIHFLKRHYDVGITFFSEYKPRAPLPGVREVQYRTDANQASENPYFFSRYFEAESRSMYGAFRAFHQVDIPPPDRFIGHVGFGNLMFFHAAYPEVPTIGYFEYFYDPFDIDSQSRPEYPVPEANRIRIPLRNATQLLELEYCTKGYSPTPYQHSTYPEAYRNKLSVLFDGVDTARYSPGPVAVDSELQRTWPADAKIVTFVSRGLEALRGFDIFMAVAHQVSLKRPDVHFVIAGKPQTHYGSELLLIAESTFKDHVLKRHPYDLNRFHFVDWLPEPALVDLFRISQCHFYWTVPFTLSWSLFQAMATGVAVLASDTLPVRDLIENNENGKLVAPYDIEGFVEAMLDMLDCPEKMDPLRQAAHDTITQQYGFDTCLPKLAEFYLA